MKETWKNISQVFFKGIFLLLPLLLSIYFLIWLVQTFDSLFTKLLMPFFSRNEIPFGVGILLGILLLLLVGFTSKYFIAQYLESWIERIIKKIPIIGAVYSSLKDIAGYAKSMKNPNAHGKSVIVNFPQSGFQIAGFLTRDNLEALPTSAHLHDHVAVYIPLAYMVGGGFTIFVKREHVHDLEIPFEKAMQLSLTAWMTTDQPHIIKKL